MLFTILTTIPVLQGDLGQLKLLIEDINVAVAQFKPQINKIEAILEGTCSVLELLYDWRT